VTNSNQSFCLEVEMPLDAKLKLDLNGQRFSHPLQEILAGARGGFIGGYGTPGYRLTAALPQEYELQKTVTDAAGKSTLPNGRDVYRLRVEQQNRQWAWSSPIWVAN